jgi:hypothetical protein
MPRGLARCTYVTDLGLSFWLWVDRDSLADVNRGWVQSPTGTLAPLGRQWLPRRVVGVDDQGHTRYTRVGTADCPLWTGGAASWSYEGSDGLSHTATVVGRQEERAPRS